MRAMLVDLYMGLRSTSQHHVGRKITGMEKDLDVHHWAAPSMNVVPLFMAV